MENDLVIRKEATEEVLREIYSVVREIAKTLPKEKAIKLFYTKKEMKELGINYEKKKIKKMGD